MLENKLGITDSTELARAEEKISKQKAIEMFENGFLEKMEPGTYESLAAIHKYLFDGIYDFAGKLRKVNLSKGSFRFAPLMYLEAALQSIDKMPQSTFDEIIEKYVEMNVAHPFREGNGRVGRLIMFKECLKYNIVPFIIEDNLKLFYYRGLKEWDNEKGYLTDICLTAQDKYKAYLDYFRIVYQDYSQSVKSLF